MISPVLLAVVCAAVLHASWNAILRGGDDRLWSMTLMMASITLVTAVATLFLPWPNAASWPYVVASAVIHVAYNLSLVHTYRSGDLGQTYPVSRGSSPVLVSLGALLFAHQGLDAVAWTGIALISGGIISLAFENARVTAGFLPAAITTAVLIGAYTVVDGVGVRLSGDSLAYVSSMFLLWSLAMLFIFWALRGRPPAYTVRQTAMALAGGLVSLLAYGIVIWAMQYEEMGVVSGLRETSIVWAALIGRLFLKEALTIRRMVSCLTIAAGAACLAR